MSTVNNTKFHLLLIEDNQADIELIRLLLAKTGVAITLHCATEGAEAEGFLFKTGEHFGDLILPDLIVMDLNIPRLDSRQLLKKIKSSRDLCKVPVVMLSTSNNDREIRESYCLGASAFISKPIDLTFFQEAIDSLIQLYFGYARLATKPGKN